MTGLEAFIAPILLYSSSDGSSTSTAGSTSTYIILMVVLVAIMYFLMIRPQRKRQKEEQEMRSSLEIGDEIVTIGGIVGRVITIREDDIVIETGADRNKLKIQRWAINSNITKDEQHKKEVDAARQASKDKKAAKGRKGKKANLAETDNVESSDSKQNKIETATDESSTSTTDEK